MTLAILEPLEAPPRLSGVQYRQADIEHVDPDEGTILMRAAPYDHEVQLDRDLWEVFAPQAFEQAAAAPHRVKMWLEHTGPLIGHAKDVEDQPDGLWVRAKFSNTLAGQEARELAADGTLDQVSVTFRPLSEWMKVTRKGDGLHVRHSKAHLLGVALVAHGAYADKAFIASVRSLDDAARARELRRARILNWTH